MIPNLNLNRHIHPRLHAKSHRTIFSVNAFKLESNLFSPLLWKRLALALVGLLCVLLLAVLTGLFATTMAERNQYQSEKAELHTSNITAEEKDNLQARLCKLGERIFDDYKCLTGLITENSARIVRE